MKPVSVAKQSFLTCFDWSLFKILAPYYLVLVAIFDISSNPFFSFIGLITGPIFTVVLIESLFAYEENSFFSLTNPKRIFLKAFKVFCTGIVSGLFILLGFIFFIIPGVILLKRYLYALIITVRDDLGPLESMRKSRKISELNGWLTLRTIFYLVISISISLLILFSVLTGSIEVAADNKLCSLITGWITQIGTGSILVFGYKNALTSE